MCSIANFSIAFADDLFLVSAATVNSFKALKQSLVDFEKLSGLRPNLSKSNVYLSGVGPEECEILCNIMGLSKVMPPVKYLGFIFISTKLSHKGCQPVFNKLKQRLQDLAAKKLSYGGRLQLIQSLFSGIYLSWTNVFMLPKAVIKKIACWLFFFFMVR